MIYAINRFIHTESLKKFVSNACQHQPRNHTIRHFDGNDKRPDN